MDPWKEFPETKPQATSNGVKGPWDNYRLVPVDIDPFAAKKSLIKDAAPFAGAIAGLGLILFLGSWLIGWVFAGFARDH